MDLAHSQPEALLELGRWLRTQDYRFTTVTPCTHWRVNRRPGREWARDLRDVFGWSRPYLPGTLPPRCLELMREAGIEAPHGKGSRSLVRASTLQDLLLFHSAFPTEAADSVFFGPDTYRFAAAIRRALDKAPVVRRAVDIGCGSGAGAIVVGTACPQAQVHAVDINPAALHLCQVNARLAGASNVQAARSDLLGALSGQFDLIVANPPYLIDPGARVYRHGGGQHGEGLSLAIVDQALPRLAPGAQLLLYTGVAIVEGQDNFLQWLRQRLAQEPVQWDYEELDPDVFGEELEQDGYEDVERLAVVCLQVRRAG